MRRFSRSGTASGACVLKRHAAPAAMPKITMRPSVFDVRATNELTGQLLARCQMRVFLLFRRVSTTQMPILAGAANLLADHRAHVIPGCAHGSRQVFFHA